MDKRNCAFHGMVSFFVESWKVFCLNMAFSNKSGRTGESEDICRLYRDKKRLFICLFFICQKCIWHHCLLCQSDSTSLFTGAVISFLFYATTENRQPKRGKITIVLMIFTFITACLIEVKWNLPLMKKIL